MPTKDELRLFQAYPLDLKIKKTQLRIKEWVDFYGADGVFVSFSGGKDSTVLLHLVRQMFPEVEAVFVNTGLEFPEIQTFVKLFDNVTILRPKMSFVDVIKEYGYPFISKEVTECVAQAKKALQCGKYIQRLRQLNGTHVDKNGNISQFNYEKYKPLLYLDFNVGNKCCDIMKKVPIHAYCKKNGKVQMTAQMASESRLRTQKWMQNGCNGFGMKHPTSNPMSFWTEQDVLQYIKIYNLATASVYGDIVSQNAQDGFIYEDTLCECGEKLCTTGCDRTGCIFCAFGAHLDKGENRFQRLKRTHPRQYNYCMNGGSYDIDEMWKPTNEGLGMAHCIEELNKIYGKDFIKI